VLHPRYRKPLRVAAVVMIATASVALAAVPQVRASHPVELVALRLGTMSHRSNPDDIRPITWREALREFGDRPVLGNGVASFRVIAAESPSPLQFAPRLHAHNLVLAVATDMGALGVVALIGLMTSLVIVIRRRACLLRARARWNDLALLAGASAALAALCGHLLVDYTLGNAQLMIAVWGPSRPSAGPKVRPESSGTRSARK
jgi:putative inorganic carbon (HCO3(-)) transporter